jgi:pimeloyl-ACP methyl ester carboxylesterase
MRVLRLDLPGSGLSGPDAAGDYSDTRTLALLVALLDQRQLGKVSVVGHSIGGRMAWTFAARHPERVNKLVLIAPDGFASPGIAYGQRPEVPASMGLMRYTLPRWMLRMNLQPAYADPAALSDALLVRYYELMLAPQSRSALLARLQDTVLVDPVPLLQSIQAPTLLLWGEQDAMIPFSNAADYVRALPHATLVGFDRVGHLPHEEASARSLAPLQQFLIAPP